MKIRSFGLGAGLAVLLALGTAPAFAEGAAAGGNESATGETRFTPRGRDVGEGRAGDFSSRDGSIRADRNYDRRRFDRPSYSGNFERRGSYAYYNGHRGYRSHRRRHRDIWFWFPLAAFAAGGAIAGAAWSVRARWSSRPSLRGLVPTHLSFVQSLRQHLPAVPLGPRAYCLSPYS